MFICELSYLKSRHILSTVNFDIVLFLLLINLFAFYPINWMYWLKWLAVFIFIGNKNYCRSQNRSQAIYTIFLLHFRRRSMYLLLLPFVPVMILGNRRTFISWNKMVSNKTSECGHLSISPCLELIFCIYCSKL